MFENVRAFLDFVLKGDNIDHRMSFVQIFNQLLKRKKTWHFWNWDDDWD